MLTPSAINTCFMARERENLAFSKGLKPNPKPKTNPRKTAKLMAGSRCNPMARPKVRPTTSPKPHPNRQWRVALVASFVLLVFSGGC